jgi:E3 ubiquitin-protein ligase TRIP12
MAPHDIPLTPAAASAAEKAALPALRPTALLHRTPWRPPTAVAASGLTITLEDGCELLDAAGGAAVTCLGHGHPAPIAAIREQAGVMSCAFPRGGWGEG